MVGDHGALREGIKPVSIAFVRPVGLPFAVYSHCTPVSFGKEDARVLLGCTGRLGLCAFLELYLSFDIFPFLSVFSPAASIAGY